MDKRLKEKGVAGPPPAAVLHFVIGLEGLSDKDKAAVGAEAAALQDLLILPDVTDKDAGEPVSRSSTTLKVMYSMAHAANHYTFDFYARVGDDSSFVEATMMDRYDGQEGDQTYLGAAVGQSVSWLEAPSSRRARLSFGLFSGLRDRP